MFNAFQWNCFNLVYTCNIALILVLKCDVSKFRIPPPPLPHNVTLRRTLSPLIMCIRSSYLLWYPSNSPSCLIWFLSIRSSYLLWYPSISPSCLIWSLSIRSSYLLWYPSISPSCLIWSLSIRSSYLLWYPSNSPNCLIWSLSIRSSYLLWYPSISLSAYYGPKHQF